jgi:hypothetical protein
MCQIHFVRSTAEKIASVAKRKTEKYKAYLSGFSN